MLTHMVSNGGGPYLEQRVGKFRSLTKRNEKLGKLAVICLGELGFCAREKEGVNVVREWDLHVLRGRADGGVKEEERY